MFRKDKMYSGEIANSMVQGMVVNYKQRIKKLHDSNTKLQQENKNLRTKNTELQMINDQLETDNQAMLRTITGMKRNKRTNQKNLLRKRIKELEFELTQVKLENECLQSDKEILIKQIEVLSRSKHEKDKSESPWVLKEGISSYDLNQNTEVRFDYCQLPDGTEYIDARKYQNGYPTRKGICLNLEDFDTFLRFGRTAWSRVVSGLFTYKNRRK